MKGGVLIIEDDDLTAHLVQIILSTRGYRVRTAPDARRGLALALKEEPDLILLDYMLPEQDGLELLADMRAMPELGTVPIIMITAAGRQEVVLRAIRTGATDFLVKPFDANVLVERVVKWAPRPDAPSGEGASAQPAESEVEEMPQPEAEADHGAEVDRAPQPEGEAESAAEA